MKAAFRTMALAAIAGLALWVGARCADDGVCVDEEVCNALDDDCDGLTDEGLAQTCSTLCGPGTRPCVRGAWGECSAPTPQTEVCDGRDNDCDGETDESGTRYYRDQDGDTYGDPARFRDECGPPPPGYVTAGGDCADQDPAIHPGATETCDGKDEDCSGTPDEGCACTSGATEPCGDWGEAGPCEPGTRTCVAGAWGECVGGVRPVAETCNDVDDDCDGATDDGLPGDGREPNDTCETASVLETMEESGSREPLCAVPGGTTLLKADGSPDTDWYMVSTVENSAPCVPFLGECCYRFTVELIPASGTVRDDVRVCYYTNGNCGTFGRQRCSTAADWNATAGAYVLTECWSGTCGSEDGKPFYMRVDGTGPSAQRCQPYLLRYKFYRTDDDC